MTNTR